MTKKLFTEKEIQTLSKNTYVKSVSEKGITYTVTTLKKDEKMSQQLAEEKEKRINDLTEKQEKKQVEMAYSQFQEKIKKYYEEMRGQSKASN